ncbi:hypothetical protein B5P44_00490 [Mycobacterium sp. CBMA 213]|nr:MULTISPECIES: hypothetical protein [unclassified Mycolicibacterium]MUL61062.1 hypothetical protein [Mycolicibacterium sp. CBMA 335]MUM03301.1 hypothetical protein [Mycolicibacterium sp. CBMA 213]
MTTSDRIDELSQRITAMTGQTLTRDQLMAVVSRAFEHRVDLDDDVQLRALVAGLGSPAAAPADPSGPAPSGLQPSPSGATAKAMAVLALLGGVGNLLASVVLVAASGYLSEHEAMPSWYGATVYVIAACGFVVAVALLTGGVMAFMRRRSGARIVVFGCALSIVAFFGDLAVTLAAASDAGAGGVGTSPIHSFMSLIIPVVTLVLALVPSTKRWLIAGEANQPARGVASGASGAKWAVVAGVAVLVVAGAGAGIYFLTRPAANASGRCNTAVAAAEDVLRSRFEFTGLVDQALPALKERVSPDLYAQLEPGLRVASTLPGADQVTSHITDLTSKQVECAGSAARVESQMTWQMSSPDSPEPRTNHATCATSVEYRGDRWIVTKSDVASA